jgi:hypothetical protein
MIFERIERRLPGPESQLAWEIWHRQNRCQSPIQGCTAQPCKHDIPTSNLLLEKPGFDANDMDPLMAGAALWSLGGAIQARN